MKKTFFVFFVLFSIFTGSAFLFKPVISPFLRTTLYPLSVITNPASVYVPIENGDVNNDGVIDYKDIQAVANKQSNADQFKDGTVNAYDFAVVVKKIPGNN